MLDKFGVKYAFTATTKIDNRTENPRFYQKISYI